MTEPKSTLSIDHAEWRVLFASNIQRVTEFVNGNATMTPEHLQALVDHLDRAKVLARAWFAAQPAVKAADVAAAQTNGIERQKRRGGWPKGKKRNAPMQVVQ